MGKKTDITDKQYAKLTKAIDQADRTLGKVFDLVENAPLFPLERQPGDELTDEVKSSAVGFSKEYAKWVKRFKAAVAKVKDTVEE